VFGIVMAFSVLIVAQIPVVVVMIMDG